MTCSVPVQVEVAARREPNDSLRPVSHFPGTSLTLQYTAPICNQRVIPACFCANIMPMLQPTASSPAVVRRGLERGHEKRQPRSRFLWPGQELEKCAGSEGLRRYACQDEASYQPCLGMRCQSGRETLRRAALNRPGSPRSGNAATLRLQTPVLSPMRPYRAPIVDRLFCLPLCALL